MINDFLTPIEIQDDFKSHQLGAGVLRNGHGGLDLSGIEIAILGVPDGRASGENGSTDSAPLAVRKQFYQLSLNPMLKAKIADLGNIVTGDSYADTEAALRVVLDELRSQQIVTIVIGGSVDLSYSMYQSLEGLDPNIDISYISPYLPFLEGEVLAKICEHKPNYLFNINALGSQMHYIPSFSSETIKKLGFEQLRLGELKASLTNAEPMIRNSHMVVFDIGVVKQSDAPANYFNNPNGLDGDKACQLCWYAGVSDLNQNLGLFEMNPKFDKRDQTAKLMAQMMWYYIDGFLNRVNDHPHKHEEFLRYRCNLDNKNPDIIFHKSSRTSRWWMEIPNPRSLHNKEMNVIVPCSYTDYQSAASGELPDRYLKTIQKMH